jgi:hypothetical protein
MDTRRKFISLLLIMPVHSMECAEIAGNSAGTGLKGVKFITL